MPWLFIEFISVSHEEEGLFGIIFNIEIIVFIFSFIIDELGIKDRCI